MVKPPQWSKVYETMNLVRREQVLASAKTELTAASRVRHPGIVRIHAIGTFPNGQAYVLQDYIEGRRLNEVMRDVVSTVQILDYLANLADALSALHQADVIHRDLKPGNVIDRASYGPVLIDFGIAHTPFGVAILADAMFKLPPDGPDLILANCILPSTIAAIVAQFYYAEYDSDNFAYRITELGQKFIAICELKEEKKSNSSY